MFQHKILKFYVCVVGVFIVGAFTCQSIFAQIGGCPSGILTIGSQSITCSTVATSGTPITTSTAIQTYSTSNPPPSGSPALNSTAYDGISATITQYTTIQLSGSPIGLASGNTVTNYGVLNSNSFTNGYGISFGANSRSSTGGNTAINGLTGEIITRGTNANGIYVAPTTAGSTGNSITNAGFVTTYGNSAAAISLMSGSTGTLVSNSIINTGTLTTAGSGSAYGIEFSSVAGTNTINNSGTITTSGGNAHAMSITSTRNTVGITNSGIVRASGTGANGINVSGAATITNSGTIGSTSGLAINFGGTLPTGAFNTLNISNGSVINGGIAFNANSTRETITFNAYSNTSFNNAITGLNIINATSNSNVVMNSSAGYDLVSGQVSVDSTSALNIGGVVKDQASPAVASSLTKIGAGTLTLSGANTYTGGTTLSAGTVAVSNNTALGTGSLGMADGTTLQAASTVTLANNISVSGVGTINTGGNDLGLTGNITGTGDIAKSGSGTLALSGANSYSGSTTVSEGTLVLSGTNTYSGQTTIAINGTLVLANAGSIANSSLVTNNGIFNIEQKTSDTTLSNYTQTNSGTLKIGLTTANAEKLIVTGSTSLAGSLYVNATPGQYSAGRYTLINSTGSLLGTFSNFTNNFDTSLSQYRLTYDGHDVFLQLDTPFKELDNVNTVQSVQVNAAGLASIYNQQVAAYQAALTYDCHIYDKNNICVSVGGRYTYSGPSLSANQQAGLVVIGYKPSQNLRYGAFADQSLNIGTPSGFSQSKTSPMWGLFAKWQMNPDESGLGIQASGVSSASTLNITRQLLSNTEAGTGSTQFNGQGYQLTTNYHQPITDSISMVPYIGLRYTRVNTGAYSENSSASVTLPLSYSAMAQNTFSAIGGIGFRIGLAENLIGTASVGIQQNLKYSMSNYQVSSAISGLENFSIAMPGNVNSMATASAGLMYDISKSERLGLNIFWQQQPFIATNTTTALASYTVGF